MHLKNIDFLKGILILLVITGHIIPGNEDETLLKYLITSFHMPLFIGISGFLFNLDKIGEISFYELFKKYRYRIIVPWIIAVTAYSVYLEITVPDNNSFLVSLLNSFIYPFYHLWFIAGFIGWIFASWFLKKLGFTHKSILFISLAISIVSFIFFKHNEIYENIPVLSEIINIVLHTFKPYFYVFFVMGIYLKNHDKTKLLPIDIFIPFILFVVIGFLFFIPSEIIYAIAFYLFNYFLLKAMLIGVKNNLLPAFKWIEWIGVNSLGIYLWHVIPVFLSISLTKEVGSILYYFMSYFIILIFLLIYSQINRIKFISKYIFGIR